MEVIGILGGMGSFATLDLFRRVLKAFPAEKEWERPRVIIHNNCTMPSRVRAILYNEKQEQLIEEMSESVNRLVESGATKILLGCITAHHFLEKLPHQEVIINAAELTAKCIEPGEIAVLCTEGSMEAGVWTKVLSHCLIVYPSEEQLKRLREFIEVVKQDKITIEWQMQFVEYINSFSCKRVVLGCTELPVLLGDCKTEKEIIDPMQCAIESISSNTR